MTATDKKRLLAKYAQTRNMLVRAHNHASEIDSVLADRIAKSIEAIDQKTTKLN